MARPYTIEESNTLKKEFLLAYEKNGGFTHSAAKTIGVPFVTAHYWMNHDPEFKAQCEEVKQLVLDRVEQELIWRSTNMRERDTSLIFFLKTKGKERGYIERVENVSTTLDELDYRTNQMDADVIQKIKSDAIKEYQDSLVKDEQQLRRPTLQDMVEKYKLFNEQ